MRRSIIARLDRLESDGSPAEWQPTLEAILNGNELPPGSAPIPLWVIKQVMVQEESTLLASS